MMTTTNLAPLIDENDVLLDEVAENQWRALDRRLPAENVAALLGFVCVVAAAFPVD